MDYTCAGASSSECFWKGREFLPDDFLESWMDADWDGRDRHLLGWHLGAGLFAQPTGCESLSSRGGLPSAFLELDEKPWCNSFTLRFLAFKLHKLDGLANQPGLDSYSGPITRTHRPGVRSVVHCQRLWNHAQAIWTSVSSSVKYECY